MRAMRTRSKPRNLVVRVGIAELGTPDVFLSTAYRRVYAVKTPLRLIISVRGCTCWSGSASLAVSAPLPYVVNRNTSISNRRLVPKGMGVTLYALSVLHRRQREREREKRMQYWREQVGGNKQNGSTAFLLMLIDGRAQNTFFENIRQMREAAEASISPLPSLGYQRDRDSPFNGRRDSGDVPQVMPTQYAPQRSGLRHHLEEDDSRIDTGSMIVMEPRIRPPPPEGGRF